MQCPKNEISKPCCRVRLEQLGGPEPEGDLEGEELLLLVRPGGGQQAGEEDGQTEHAALLHWDRDDAADPEVAAAPSGEIRHPAGKHNTAAAAAGRRLA